MKSIVRSITLAAVLAFSLCAVESVAPQQQAHAVGSASYVCSATYDPASLTTLTQTSSTITCPGVRLGDFTEVSSSLDNALVTITAYVSAADTVTILVFNGSSGTINLASSTFRVKVQPHL